MKKIIVTLHNVPNELFDDMVKAGEKLGIDINPMNIELDYDEAMSSQDNSVRVKEAIIQLLTVHNRQKFDDMPLAKKLDTAKKLADEVKKLITKDYFEDQQN
jgi:hypothetical protein